MRRLRRAYQRRARRRAKFRERAVAAGAAAVVTFGVGASLDKVFAKEAADGHQLAVSRDADGDLLADGEEAAIGYQPFVADQNRNAIADGVELAQRCAAAIDGLYVYIPGTMMPIPNETYRVRHVLFGVERCDICGQEVNMGGSEILNPRLGLRYPDPNDSLDGAFLPDLALHYMKHGSFDCLGDVHSGRADVARLLRVLDLRYPFDPDEHQLPVDGDDLDRDLLADAEELAAGYDLYNADQDGNLLPDGIEIATQCAEVIDSLPVFDPNGPEVHALYKESFLQRGLEYCGVCGSSVNMGYWRITNLKFGLSIDVPEIVLHYMKHGSFSYTGDIHGKGRMDLARLVKILEMPRRCGDLGTIYLPSDLNKDCQVDSTDFLEFVERWLRDTEPNQSK
ncbi:MAG: hypothetical protein P8Z79_12355 [Sedimentisphaerales bacterium]|jgi:hypothetical protein